MRPMLATPGPVDRARPVVPTGPQWSHEIKWDGIRLLVEVTGSRVRLSTRTERDVTVAFPELRALGGIAPDVLLDGEVVTLLDGRPSFTALAERVHTVSARRAEELAAARPVTYLAFDLLRLDGLDLTGLPWGARRQALEQLVDETGPVRLSPVYDDGRELLAATAEQGLEGVVSKRVTSRYRPGVRSPDWLKFPHRRTASWVVGGWRPETGRSRLGSVLVGAHVAGGLSYRGRVGSGLAGKAGDLLAAQLARLPVLEECPFVDEVPAPDRRGATWVEPRLVVDVASLEVTSAGRLRQPSYQGWRPDLTPEDL